MSLRLRSWGSGPERLVLLHGFTGTGDSFAQVPFDDRFTVFAPDLPGHGESAPATNWDGCLALLEPLVTPQTTLAGYSMGARLALALALRRPPARLVLESGSPGLPSELERLARQEEDEALARFLEEHGLAAFVERWEKTPVLAGLRELPLQAQAALRARRLGQSVRGLASALRALGSGAQPRLWSQLQRLHVPTLLIAGARDEKYAGLARRMDALLPEAQVALVPASGHTPHLEQPHAYAALINPARRTA